MHTVSDELPYLCSRHCRIFVLVLFLVGHVLWIIHVIVSATVLTAYFQQCYVVCRETVSHAL